jgi:2-polyprenyl-3-methyl-5-hydroxy-6-metoxy-1,4-benzoquinol methylase
MKIELLELLHCPVSGQKLELKDGKFANNRVETGRLVTPDEVYSYPITSFIPRFVPESNYADNFGMQWKKFRQTQLDSFSGHPISKNRFFSSTKWSDEIMSGKWTLDIGCGAGRFAEVALQTGAKVVALDYSTAVDACYANLKHYENFHIVQGDIYALPFKKGSFSFVYSLGVLQHTPDPKKSFFSLPGMLKPGGQFCIDFYQKTWKSFLLPKYWLRPITKRISKPRLFSILQKTIPVLLPMSNALGNIPLIGSVVRRIIPVANFQGEFSLNKRQHYEWSLLDTFDWLSPEYDNPQTKQTVELWMKQTGMQNIEVFKDGHLVAKGIV